MRALIVVKRGASRIHKPTARMCAAHGPSGPFLRPVGACYVSPSPRCDNYRSAVMMVAEEKYAAACERRRDDYIQRLHKRRKATCSSAEFSDE